MITLILALLSGGGAFSLAYYAGDFGTGWSVFSGIVGFLAVQVSLSVYFMRKIKTDMLAVQKIMTEGQKELQAKMARWQIRPPGSMQEAQRIVFEDTCRFVKAAIAETEKLGKYRPWVMLIDKQIATAKLQLNWMIKNFKEVDALMKKAMFVDPVSVSMKMARMQMLDEPIEKIAKVYEKCARRLKYNQNQLLAGTYTWILVKRGDVDGAFKALTAALKNTDDATLRRNHEALMNNRVAHFNNSGLGDQWYALHLEEPKIRQPRQRSAFR